MLAKQKLLNKNFMLFFIVIAQASLGSSIAIIALAFLVLQLTGSASAMALTLGLRILPNIFLPFIATYIDRVNVKIPLTVSFLLRGILLVALYLAISSHLAGINTVYIVALVNGILATVTMPSCQIIIPNLVGKDNLVRGNSILNMAEQSMALFGYLAGGAIVAWLGPLIAVLIEGIAYVLCTGLILPIHIRIPKAKNNNHFFKDMAIAWRFMLQFKLLALVTVMCFFINAFFASVEVFLPLHMRLIAEGAAGYGFFMGAMMVGMLLGSFTIALFAKWFSAWRTVSLGWVALAAAFLGLGVINNFTSCLVWGLCLGLGVTAINTSAGIMFQKTLNVQYLGRLNGLSIAISNLGMPFAFFAISLSVNHFEFADFFIIGSGIALLFAILWFLYCQRQPKKLFEEEYQLTSKQSIDKIHPDEKLMYLIFTSGSTGKPKGVMLANQGIVNRLHWMQQQYPLTAKDVILQKTPYGFDVSVWELFWPLLTGASLCFAKPEGHKDPAYLQQLIKEKNITTMHFVPSMLRVFLETLDEKQLSSLNSLRQVFCSGEGLPTELAIEALKKLPAKLHNLYGPTEASIDVSYWDCSQATSCSIAPIGKPIANTKLYILDKHLQPVPVGVAGELYIAGDGLAKGYINQVELTAERFIENPFSTEKDRQQGKYLKLYRTGDLARYLTDGNIEYLGRTDEQVKLRGFRIELGEIAAVLMQHQLISQAVVIAKTINSEQQLIGYYAASQPIDETELREHLNQSLPEYMVPAYFMHLTTMPLSINGKVDRKQLPEISLAASNTNQYVAASTLLEQQLIDIWQRVLKREHIGIKDDFFLLGGNSLSAVQVASRVQRELQLNYAINQLFTDRTIEKQAETLSLEKMSFAQVSIAKVDRNKPILASSAQQRLWFIENYEKADQGNYHISIAMRLTGKVNLSALQSAINHLVARHESLRTSFVEDEGKIYQLIHKELPLVVEQEIANEIKLKSILYQEVAKPFDLQQGPLTRVVLIEINDTESVLLIVQHHIISDGWSIKILLEEFAACYLAEVNQQKPTLAELDYQVADFTVWQQQLQNSISYDKQLNFWQQQLKNFQTLVFPADYTRPLRKTYHGQTIHQALSTELVKNLKSLANEQGASLFMLLLAVLKVVLQRYSRQDDMVIGTPVAGRNHAAFDNTLGLFVNTLVLRNNLANNPNFIDLLTQVKQTCLTAFANQDVPFEKLLECLPIERDLSYDPIFQIMFVLEEGADQLQFNLANTQTELLDLDSDIAKFDLTIYVTEQTSTQWKIKIEYNTDLFKESTIQLLAKHFTNALKQVSESPELPIHSYNILSAEESQQQLIDFNSTIKSLPNQYCLHELFEKQAKLTPLAVAVTSSKGNLTYQQLEHRSNQIANKLAELAVKPNSLVAICMEKGIEQVIAALAIIKAGAAYLPISSTEPEARIQQLLKQGEVSIVLTQQAQQDKVPTEYLNFAVDNLEIWNSYSTDAVDCPATANDLAYVIFTSGSTGTPKGVMIKHKSALNTIVDINLRFSMTAEDKVFALSALNFDLSVYDIFGPLYCGGKIIIPEENAKKDPEAWLALIEKEEITVWNSVPALLQMLVDYIDINPISESRKQALAKLRLVLLSGDWIPLDLPGRIKHFADCEVISLGGATEGSIWSILNPIDQVDFSLSSIPYGKPMWNQKFFIRDPYLQLLPQGIPGELCIGGIGVAEGYWRDQERTEQSFVKDPITEEMIYRTGDMGRYLDDGTIEFLGRQDSQVKLRGFRVELGDIEACIKRFTSIEKVVVLLDEQQNLIAYYITTDNDNIDHNELRGFLKEQLPEYMVPTSFIKLDTLPLTTNGKIDKKALLKLFTKDSSDNFIEPETQVQKELVKLWQDVLKVAAPISLHDNFFYLGGNSLLVIQLLSRIKSHFSCQVELRDLFENSALIDQAKLVEQQSKTKNYAEIIKTSQQTIPLSFAQQRLWFLYQYQGQQATNYNIPVAIQLNGAVNSVCLEIALNKLIKRQQSLQTVFTQEAGVLQQKLMSEMTVAINTGQTTLSNLDNILREEALYSFDLLNGPLIKVNLYQINSETSILFINMHHIISDGLSMKIFLHELSALYIAELNEQQCELEPLIIQYADYASWQRNIDLNTQQKQLTYWQQQLANVEPLELPLDYSRPAEKTYHGAQYHFELPKELVREFSTLLDKNHCTLYMGLLAVFGLLLSRYSQQDDIVIGSPVSNRQQKSVENLIGLFVNTLAMRLDFSSQQNFTSILKNLRETCLQAFSNSDVPFEQIINSLQLDRDTSRDPIFQVLFSYEDNSDLSELKFADLDTQEIKVDYAISKFDLSLYAINEAERFTCYFEYNTDLFKEARIARMAKHFTNLLQTILTSTNKVEVKKLSFMDNEELNYLYRQLNQTETFFPKEETIHSLFLQQAIKTPNAIAVADEKQSLTYEQLDKLSSQLAVYLQQTYQQQTGSQLSADCLIAICLERSVNLLVSLLAILKAGAGYLPLDVNHPVERLEFILTESNAKLILSESTQSAVVDSLKDQSTPIYLDRIDYANGDIQLIDNITNPTDLIYVIYTSGSTGKPKGVMLEHSAIVNRLHWMQARYPLTTDDIVLQKTPYTFDVSVWELFWPIIVGAKLYFAKPEGHKDPQYLAQIIKSEAITCMHFVPSMLKTFLSANHLTTTDLSCLKQVFCSGEALPMVLVNEFNSLLKNTALHNLYGPTEAAIDVSYWNCNQASSTVTAPIGKPIDNIKLYILDSALQPVPIGVPGELYIAGVGLARAYLQRPELTAERFIHVDREEFSAKRLYKTGDLVCYLEDGNIEYLGRTDDQVKLRGFRIELGEIAAVLNQHPAIDESAAITTGQGKQQQLLAYFTQTINKSIELTSEQIRDYLADKLPDYMLPNHFIRIEKMPLSVNGKLDKKALAKIKPELTAKTSKQQLPTSELEKQIAQLWKKLLDIESISTDASFFTVGGNSLLAVELCNELQAIGFKQLRIVDIFKAPTIAAQATLLSKEATTVSANNTTNKTEDRGSQKQRMNKLLNRKRSVKQTN